jgi:hypothetical protein
MHSVEYTLQMNSMEYGKRHALSSKSSSPMGSSSVPAISMSRGTGSGRERESVHSSVSSATQFLRSSVEELAKLRDKFRFSSRHARGRDGKNLLRQQR